MMIIFQYALIRYRAACYNIRYISDKKIFLLPIKQIDIFYKNIEAIFITHRVHILYNVYWVIHVIETGD